MKFKGFIAAGIVTALVLVAGSPAGAAGPYDNAGGWTTGTGGSTGTWAADADADIDGTFSLSASVDDPGTSFDSNIARAQADIGVTKQFVLTAGTYKATISFTGIDATTSGTGAGLASATVGWSLSCDCTVGEWGGDSGGIAAHVSPGYPTSVSNASNTTWFEFTTASDGSVEIGASAMVNTGSGVATIVSFHGGTASASMSGTVESITVKDV